MAYTPEQVQFLVPKLSTGNSPFSLALMRQQSALASVHTGDRDPYDPFSPNIDQSGSNQPFSDIELTSNDFQNQLGSGNNFPGSYEGDTDSSSFSANPGSNGSTTSEAAGQPVHEGAPSAEQFFAPESPSAAGNNNFNPAGSSAPNRSIGGGGGSASSSAEGSSTSFISETQADTPTLSVSASTTAPKTAPLRLISMQASLMLGKCCL